MNKNYRKIYFHGSNMPVTNTELCHECIRKNIMSPMKFMSLNMNESIYKCSGEECMYPFKNFMFKDMRTNRMYKYEFENNPSLSSCESAIVHSAVMNPPSISTTAPSDSQNTKIELQKCLKSRQKLPLKLSKYDDVNQLLNVYNSANKSSNDCNKLNKISSINPLNLIQHLNRSTAKIAKEDT